jgi:hypothetical protein
MHTLAVIVGGILLLGVFVVLGRLFSGASAPAFAAWALYFIPAWLIASAANMWIGVRNAGYSFGEELPIFLLVFALPSAIAAFLWWKLSR